MGVRLFDRSQQGVHPTAFGEILLERGAALLDRADDLQREIQLLAGLETGTLVIGAGPYASEVSVGPAVARLLRTHPHLNMRVITESPDEIARGVLDGEFDVGVASYHRPTEALRVRVEKLSPRDLILACRPGHPLAGKRGLSLEQILKYPLVSTLLAGDAALTASIGAQTGHMVAGTATFAPAIHVNSLSMARQIAAGSDALFPATLTNVASDVTAGALAVLDFHCPAMRTNHSLIVSLDRTLSPAAQAFMGALKETEAELARDEARSRVQPIPRRTASRELAANG